MKYSYLSRKSPVIFLLIPAIVAFCIAMVLTLKYNWPLSGDIFYHIHLAKLYLEQGLVFWDPLTSAPYGGPIVYPPMFHIFLIFIGFLYGEITSGVRLVQPVLTMMIFLSFSYVAYKFYESPLVGVTAGFFIFFSMVFQRFLLPLPENLALILFPLVIYYFYRSIEIKSYINAFISGLLAGLLFLTHLLSASMLLLVTFIYSMVMGFKNKNILKYWLIFVFGTLIVASLWWLPLLIKYGMVFNFNGDIPYSVSLFSYPKFFGVITLVFAILGAYIMIKRRLNQDILILTFLVSILLLSNLNYLGVPILSNRILTFALFPLLVMAGVGVNYLFEVSQEKKVYKKLFFIFISLIYGFAVLVGFSMLVDFDKGILWLRASDSELGVAEWFEENGDKKSVVVAYNFRDSFIVALSRQPVAMAGYGQAVANSMDMQKYFNGKANKSDYLSDNVGYVVLYSSMNAPPYTKLVYNNSVYSIYLFNP